MTAIDNPIGNLFNALLLMRAGPRWVSHTFISFWSKCVRPSVIAGLVVFFPSLAAISGAGAQQAPPQSRGETIPTFDSLPHRPLPPGFFEAWCGSDERFLMERDRHHYLSVSGNAVLLPDLPKDLAPGEAQCVDEGRQLVYVDDQAGLVTQLDVGSGIKSPLARYRRDEMLFPRISISPDQAYLASDRPLEVVAGATNLKVLLLQPVANEAVTYIRWKTGSSMLFVIARREGGSEGDVVHVFDRDLHEIGTGKQLPGMIFRDGWFADGGADLIFYVASVRDENGAGLLVRCRIADLKCGSPMTKVQDASAASDGLLIVRGDRAVTSAANDEEILPRHYTVDLKRTKARSLVHQVFTWDSRPFLSAALSPSGTKVILTWDNTEGAQCARFDHETVSCKSGEIVEVPRNMR